MTQRSRGKRDSGGFTLVEVLAAVTLLSLGLLGVLAAATGARKTQHRATAISVGRMVAQNKIEVVRSAPIDTIDAMDSTTTDSSLPRGNSVVLLVAGYPLSSETNLYKASVTVTWPEERGTRKVYYETLIARK